MDWMKILSAGFAIMMLIYLWPRAMHMMKNSPKGSNSDWQAFILPMVAIVGFVALLIWMVRN